METKNETKPTKRTVHYPMFDSSTIPDDLCPIATELIVMRTGEWRAERPIVLRSKCVKCGTCWAYCPVQCIQEKPTWFEADLNRCKGCSICRTECPHHAIIMVEEKE
ncbi:MAG TPA: 4Fe-4S binding protein [Thermodesulfobacteriota bacterium]|nr:4Fe-4S binding protein [Thermodesulfobacteriota bacterium]